MHEDVESPEVRNLPLPVASCLVFRAVVGAQNGLADLGISVVF